MQPSSYSMASRYVLPVRVYIFFFFFFYFQTQNHFQMRELSFQKISKMKKEGKITFPASLKTSPDWYLFLYCVVDILFCWAVSTLQICKDINQVILFNQKTIIMKHRFSQNIYKNTKFIEATKHFHGTSACAVQRLRNQLRYRFTQ